MQRSQDDLRRLRAMFANMGKPKSSVKRDPYSVARVLNVRVKHLQARGNYGAEIRRPASMRFCDDLSRLTPEKKAELKKSAEEWRTIYALALEAGDTKVADAALNQIWEAEKAGGSLRTRWNPNTHQWEKTEGSARSMGLRKHLLLPKELEKKFPALGSTDKMPYGSRKVIAKFFSPYSDFTWYAMEYDPKDRVFFGYVTRHNPELSEFGYFSLDELENTTQKVGGYDLPAVERDKYYGVKTFAEVGQEDKQVRDLIFYHDHTQPITLLPVDEAAKRLRELHKEGNFRLVRNRQEERLNPQVVFSFKDRERGVLANVFNSPGNNEMRVLTPDDAFSIGYPFAHITRSKENELLLKKSLSRALESKRLK